MLKIWLDDIRTPPDNSWNWCKNVEDAFIAILTVSNHNPELSIIISFDHDLGENTQSGYDLAKAIERNYHMGSGFNIQECYIHSANPVGRNNIRMALESAGIKVNA